MRSLWEEMREMPADLRLYGGTALALYLNHRRSTDFDFATPKNAVEMKLCEKIPWLMGARNAWRTGNDRCGGTQRTRHQGDLDGNRHDGPRPPREADDGPQRGQGGTPRRSRSRKDGGLHDARRRHATTSTSPTVPSSGRGSRRRPSKNMRRGTGGHGRQSSPRCWTPPPSILTELDATHTKALIELAHAVRRIAQEQGQGR